MRAAMTAKGIESSTPSKVARMAIWKLSLKPVSSSPKRSKLGGKPPLKIRAARGRPSEIRAQLKGSEPNAQTRYARAISMSP